MGNLAISDLTILISTTTTNFFREIYGSSGFVKADKIESNVWCMLNEAVSHVFIYASFGFMTLVSLETFLCHLLSNQVSKQ